MCKHFVRSFCVFTSNLNVAFLLVRSTDEQQQQRLLYVLEPVNLRRQGASQLAIKVVLHQ